MAEKITVYIEELDQNVTFPPGTSPEEMKKAIRENFPQSNRRNFGEGFAQGLAQTADLAPSLLAPMQNAPQQGPVQNAALTAEFGTSPENIGRPEFRPSLSPLLEQQGIAPDPGSALGKVGEFSGGSAAPAVQRAAAGSTLAQRLRGFLNELNQGAMAGAGAVTANQVAPDSTVAEIGGAIVAPTAIQKSAAGLTRGAFRGFNDAKRSFQDALNDFEEVGATPTPAQASRRGGAGAVEASVSRLPFGWGRFHTRALKTQQQMGKFIKRIAGGNNDSTSSAGRIIQEGLFGSKPNSFSNRFRSRSRRLYNKLDRLIPAGTPMATANTDQVLSEIATTIPRSPKLSAALGNQRVNNIAKAFNEEVIAGGGQLRFDQMQAMRSAVGRMMSTDEVISQAPRADLDRLYKALSEDIRIVAQKQGPEAAKAFEQANKFYSAGIKRIDNFVERLNRKAAPEAVFKDVISGNGEDATKLFAIRRSLTSDQWDYVRQTQLNRLGRATPGKQDEIGEVFSSETFLTNWNKISPRAKKALYGSNDETREALDTLARVSARIRETGGVLANPSGTAGGFFNAEALFTVLSGAGVAAATGEVSTGIGSVIAGSVANNAVARLMTSDWFPRWLAQSTKIPVEELPGHISRLNIAVPRNPDDIAAAQWYLDQLTPGVNLQEE